MKNLFLAAKCYAVLDLSDEIGIFHLINAANSIYIDKNSLLYEMLKYNIYDKYELDSSSLGSNRYFYRIENIFKKIDKYDYIKYSYFVSEFKREMEEHSC